MSSELLRLANQLDEIGWNFDPYIFENAANWSNGRSFNIPQSPHKTRERFHAHALGVAGTVDAALSTSRQLRYPGFVRHAWPLDLLRFAVQHLITPDTPRILATSRIFALGSFYTNGGVKALCIDDADGFLELPITDARTWSNASGNDSVLLVTSTQA